MAKKPRTKPAAKITGAHRLLIGSWRFGKTHWRQLAPIAVVATIVNILLRLGLSQETAGLYQGIWFIITSCALIWTVRHAEDKNTKVSLGEAFYTGSAPGLKFFLVLMLVALMSLPFSAGVFIYSAVTAVTTFGANAVEQVVAGGILLLLSLLTLFLAARSLFALIIVTLPDSRPILAFKTSWRLSRGRTNSLVGRLLVPLLYGSALLVGVILLTSLIPSTTAGEVLLEIAIGMAVLPFFYIYLYKLYRELV